ncbi:hypothetical protein [[Flexibacter] sp. ATCC 35208]|uniref:hypothetical protein n=1 Tax=[Flexibacter] sp. ATCC 35208 TaxID=1936242 RepID=UPI0009D06D05|nr:hypothetical protein [[Flexibacter] sp. ATCC 35208]OMP80095.1 hypothetical protein BW716_06275 [[Flexibacter] sp. ATCC 35208]
MDISAENIKKVKNQVAEAGWGNRFDTAIDEFVKSGESKIKLPGSETIDGKHQLNAELDFSIGKDILYYNGWKGTLTKEGEENSRSQFFPYYDKISMGEGANLLIDGDNPRAVYKNHFYDESGNRYGAWLKVDFSQKTESGNHVVQRFNDKYGFNPYEVIQDYAIVGFNVYETRKGAIMAMQQGAEIIVQPVNRENYDTVRMSANPEKRSFAFRSMDGKFLYHDQFRTKEALEKRKGIQPSQGSTSVSFVPDKPDQQKTRGVNETDADYAKAHSSQAGTDEVKKKEVQALGSNKSLRKLAPDKKNTKGIKH